MTKYLLVGVLLLVLAVVVAGTVYQLNREEIEPDATNQKTPPTQPITPVPLTQSVPAKESTYKYIGCYKDEKERTLPTYHGQIASIPLCFEAAKKSGHTHFGIQNGNECYSGKGGHDKFLVESDNDCKFKFGAVSNAASDKIESGGNWRNAVYQIFG